MIYAIALFAFLAGFMTCEWIEWYHKPTPLEPHPWERTWRPTLVR